MSSTPIDTPLADGRHTTYAFTDINQVRISEQPKVDGLSIRTSSFDSSRGQITCSLTHEPNGNAILHINLPELNLPLL